MIKKSEKLVCAFIALIGEKYHGHFKLSNLLFTANELIEKANTLFNDSRGVAILDLQNATKEIGNSSTQKYFVKGSSASLNDYFRLACPEEVQDYDWRVLIDKLMPTVYEIIPEEYPDATNMRQTARRPIKFVNEYFDFMASHPTTEQASNGSMSSREAVWIATAALTYNEYKRTGSYDIESYFFPQSSISRLAFVFNPQTAMSTYSQVTGQMVTHGKNNQQYSYLMADGNRRRLAANGEADKIVPEQLALDFPVNTIDGVRTVGELLDFISGPYTHFIASGDSIDQPISNERKVIMSFQKEKFIAYLMDKGDRNANTYCSYLSRLERDFNVTIDAEYDSDHFEALSNTLQLKFDEARIDDKKMYEALKQMRQALRKYGEFRASVEPHKASNEKDHSGVVASEEYVVEEQEVNSTDIALNTILYGPPGTGKTYHTVLYAVAIVENRELDSVMAEDYEDVQERYNWYKNQGLIEFTTFHQSYGYEEFIEGIRPVVVEDTEQEVSGNIQYSVQPGAFKKFCEKAERPVSDGADATSFGIRDNATIWKVSLWSTGDNEYRTECLENGHIRIGWDRYGKDIIDETDFSIDGGRVVLNAFINKMQIGDIVLSCYSASTIDAIGVVTGEYEWHDEYHDLKRLRKVNWIVKDVRENIMEINGGTAMTLASVYRLNNIALSDVYGLIEKYNCSTPDPVSKKKNHVFIIDEINRGNISKIFGELITLLEEPKRVGKSEAHTAVLPYSQKAFGVPQNVYIIGTMNTADRSIATIDTALRRRFTFREMMPNPDVLDGVAIQGISIKNLLERMNRRIEVLYDREHTIGHAYFTSLRKEPSVAALARIFKNNIIPLLQEYFYEDYEKIRLVLGDNRKALEEQFIVRKDNNYIDLFGDAEIELDIEYTYEINSAAFDNPEAYRQI